MDAKQENISINMIRSDLEGIPSCPLPSSFSARWYQPGYKELWLKIQSSADKYNIITPELFDKEFGADPRLLAERQCFLFDIHGTAIGTATAWFNDNYQGQNYGRIHWVAILPEMQGHGLAKPLMSIVCNRLRDMGHKRAYLNTSTARIPAINLYLKFGFVPEIRSVEDLNIWRKLQKKLKEPLDLRVSV